MKNGENNVNNINVPPFVRYVPNSERVEDKSETYKAEFKAQLMMFLNERIKEMNLNQKEAGKALGITQAQVSLLKNMRLSQFTVDKLLIIAFSAGYTFGLIPYSIDEVDA